MSPPKENVRQARASDGRGTDHLHIWRELRALEIMAPRNEGRLDNQAAGWQNNDFELIGKDMKCWKLQAERKRD